MRPAKESRSGPVGGGSRGGSVRGQDEPLSLSAVRCGRGAGVAVERVWEEKEDMEGAEREGRKKEGGGHDLYMADESGTGRVVFATIKGPVVGPGHHWIGDEVGKFGGEVE